MWRAVRKGRVRWVGGGEGEGWEGEAGEEGGAKGGVVGWAGKEMWVGLGRWRVGLGCKVGG